MYVQELQPVADSLGLSALVAALPLVTPVVTLAQVTGLPLDSVASVVGR